MAKEKEAQTGNRVEVFIPRVNGSTERTLFVGVNGVNYVLQRGKKHMVPDFVAEEVKRGLAAEDTMYEERDRLQTQAKD